MNWKRGFQALAGASCSLIATGRLKRCTPKAAVMSSNPFLSAILRYSIQQYPVGNRPMPSDHPSCRISP